MVKHDKSHGTTILRRHLVALWACAIFLAGIAVAVAPAAFAAPSWDIIVPTATYGPKCTAGISGSLCQTDNAAVTYYMDSNGEYELEAADRSDVRNALARYHNNTDVTISYDSSPTFSGGGETDIVFQEGMFGDGTSDGITWCDDPVDGSSYRCDQQYIRIRGAGVITPMTAGHEAGHALGLTHGAQASPMMGPCDQLLGIMRAYTWCLEDAALGALVRDNVNWIY